MKKILIVEDNPDISQTLSIRFESNGFEILTADNVTDAQEMALSELPNLVLLDIFLPGGDGFDVAELIRVNPESMHTPIIFITASKNKSFVSRAHAYQAFDFFEKPYDVKKLMFSVLSAMSARP